MERTDTRNEVNELAIIIEGYIPDHMPSNFWTAYQRLVQLAKQAGWPQEIHRQYMYVLDERDKLQEELDLLRVDMMKYKDRVE